MAILGTLLKQGIKLRRSIEQDNKPPLSLQARQLYQLLSAARGTAFGKYYDFDAILDMYPQGVQAFMQAYQERVPLFNYDSIYEQWWHRAHKNAEPNVAWKGRVKYFALSSGTSGSPSKHIPVTQQMLKAIHRASIRQILSLSNFKEVPSKMYSKGLLALGGSTHLNRRGTFFEGDLSGITASNIPFWFQHFYKPGRRIAKNTDWDAKLEEIVRKAEKWDIAFMAGVPAWIQIMMEKIIEHYKLNNIHELWPNLTAYAFGGVSFDPYRKGFEKLLGKPIIYIETYLASEGFIAFQTHPNQHLRLILNNGIFFEFVPFNEDNFDADGELLPQAKALTIDQVEEETHYALLLSTCAGAWRYLIGDVIQFVNKERSEIIITGRTKHFLSLCGEHLSVDNMNKAIELVSEELNLAIKEFTVAGVPHDTLFAHQWYIGSDENIDETQLRDRIDAHLQHLNDDYKVERSAALKEICVKVLPTALFYKWLETQGKVGGQHKFPRVLKKAQYQAWLSFLETQGIPLPKASF
ncbi:GH3 family domain-containing protein [Eisenibacter elegans]|uniref:GH3 family domain-containing protein n=1 Tax=Eisenibacter elegans TaxID=997 RepID=UPI000416840F|nr:GH3 auxin-responsive promoter family protein [Eisenibacter elegans]